MNGTTNDAIPELLGKINLLRQRAGTDEKARRKLELLRRVLTCSMMGVIPASSLAVNPKDVIV